jgi:hypothetical protein
MPKPMSSHSLEKNQRAADRARPAKLAGHDPGAAGLAVADRDLAARFPQVELQQLPGPVDGALIGPPALEHRPDLAQVVVEDRLGAVIAQFLDQLADPLARDPRVVLQQAMDLVLERVELRRSRRALIARRALPSQRATHGVAIVAGAPGDLVDREPFDLLHPPDLRPAPHVEHDLPPRQSQDLARLGLTPDETDNPSGGCDFNRPSRVIVQAAPTIRGADRPEAVESSSSPSGTGSRTKLHAQREGCERDALGPISDALYNCHRPLGESY